MISPIVNSMNISIQSLRVERIRKNDIGINILRDMDRICFPEDSPPLFYMSYNLWWIVYNKENPIAYAGARKRTKYLEFIRVGVLPEHRGKGIQKLLIQERTNYAKEHSKIGCITYTSTENIRSIYNLVDFGFRLWKPTGHYKVEKFLNWKLDI